MTNGLAAIAGLVRIFRDRKLVLAATLVALAILVIGGSPPSPFAPALGRWQGREIVHLALVVGLISGGLAVAMTLRLARGWGVAAAALALIVLFGFGPVAATAILALVALVIGRLLVAWADGGNDARQGAPLTMAIGYAVLVAILQISVHFAINTPTVAVLAIALFLGVTHRRWLGPVATEASTFCRAPFRPGLAGICLAVPLSLVAVLMVYASYPESHSDALAINLMMAHRIAVAGAWSFDAQTFAFADQPKAGAWLYALHYLLGGEPAARLFNAMLQVLTAAMVFLVAARQAGRAAAALLAGMLLSAPPTFWITLILLDDAALSLFVTAGLIAALNAWRRPGFARYVLAALLLSAAMAAKLQGGFVALPLGLILLVRLARTARPSEMAATVVAILAVFAAIGALPYAYAALATGNPIFPYFNGVFQSPYYPPIDFVDDRWIGKFGADLLVQLTLHTSRFMEGMDGTFGVQHLLLLPPILVAGLWRQRAEFHLVLVTAVISAGLTLAATQYGRYLYPTFPMLALLGATIYRRARREHWGAGFLALLVLIAVANLALTGGLATFYRFQLPNPLAARPAPQPFPVPERWFNQIVNAHDGNSSRVLYLGGRPYGFGLDGQPLYAAWFTPKTLVRLGEVTKPTDVAPMLASLGITHVTLDSDWLDPDPGIAIVRAEIDHLGRLEASLGSGRLYTIAPPLAMPDTDIKLGGDQAARLLGRGWMAPESWGTWAKGDGAELTFRAVGRPQGAEVRLTGSAMPFASEAGAPVVVKVECGGKPVGQLVFDRRQTIQPWSLTIPDAAIGDDGVIALRLTFDPTDRPPPSFRVGFIAFRLTYR